MAWDDNQLLDCSCRSSSEVRIQCPSVEEEKDEVPIGIDDTFRELLIEYGTGNGRRPFQAPRVFDGHLHRRGRSLGLS
jgi:hypothetical protein